MFGVKGQESFQISFTLVFAVFPVFSELYPHAKAANLDRVHQGCPLWDRHVVLLRHAIYDVQSSQCFTSVSPESRIALYGAKIWCQEAHALCDVQLFLGAPPGGNKALTLVMCNCFGQRHPRHKATFTDTMCRSDNQTAITLSVPDMACGSYAQTPTADVEIENVHLSVY